MESKERLDMAVVQMDATPGRRRSLDAIGTDVLTTGGDVILLPEMFATGFRTDASEIAQPMDGPIVTALREWAVRGRKAVVGSVAVVEEGRYYNRMIFAKPSGDVVWYDKRHLFRPGGESDEFTAGNRRTVVEYKGFRFLLQLCYDLRFPVWSRCRGDYDVILYSAAWPESRREVWRTLLRARAIENQACVVGANFAGKDETGRYAGCSAMINCFGETLYEGDRDGEDCHTAAFYKREQEDFRNSFPAWRDADDFRMQV